MSNKQATNPDARYYVWEMKIRSPTEPLRQLSKEPLALKPAKQLARIGATEGKHDRTVTTSPRRKKEDFRVVAHYEAGTGKNITRKVWK